MKQKIHNLITLICLFLSPSLVLAKDFGRLGNIFQISEESFLSMVSRRLGELDLESLKLDLIKKSMDRAMKPSPVRNLSKTGRSSSHIFDPTYILDRDVSMPDGTVMFRKDHKINPLDFMDFDRRLYFIDGNDEEQIDWVRSQLAEGGNKKIDYVILTKGSPVKLEKLLDREIYFDQFGELTSKFKITSIPAMVEQREGKRFLTISQIGL